MGLAPWLPLLGGIVPLCAGFYLLAKKGAREPTQAFFFLSLLTLGLFGLLETIAYLSSDKAFALIMLKISKASAFSSAYFFMGFATHLRGKENWHKTMAPFAAFILIISWIFIIEDIQKISCGWSVTFNRGMVSIAYMMVVLMMIIGLAELHTYLKEIQGEGTPLYKSLRRIMLGFLLLLTLSITTNMTVGLGILNGLPVFSIIQAIPAIIITHAYITGTKVAKKRDG